MANSDGQVRIIIDTNAKEAANELDKTSKAFDNSGKAAQNASTAYNKVSSTLKTLVGAYVGVRGAQMTARYIMDSVEAYRAQERAIASLNTTLQNAGVYSAQYAQQIQALASEIQKYSNYGDEAIIKAQALGQSFAGQVPITQEATKAVVDFAAATGMDLEQAFALFGKSVGSSTNALSRYGIELQKGMTDAQKMDSIVAQLGERYAGQAEQMANKSTQLKNAMGDLAEVIGNEFNPIIEGAQSLLIKLANATAKNITLAHQWLESERSTLKGLANAWNEYWDSRRKGQGMVFEANPEWLQKQKESGIFATSTPATTSTKSNIKPFKIRDDYSYFGGSGGVSKTTAAAKIKEELGAYDALNKKISELKAQMLDMITLGQQDSDAFSLLKNNYISAVDEMENVNKTFSQSFKKDFENIFSSLSSNLSNALLTPLREGETYLQRFGQLGLNIVNQIGSSALKFLIEEIALEKVKLAIKTSERFSKFFTLSASANGNVFKNGNVIPFASGGVVSQPTTFPMANGSTGLMGEAGAEAIMPLKRGSNGKLGVEASGASSTVNIYNYSDSRIETVKRPNGDTDVFIKKVNAALSSERTQSGFSAAMQRNNNVGIQAS